MKECLNEQCDSKENDPWSALRGTMYWMKGFVVSCLITVVKSAAIRSDIDRRQHICGTQIAIQLAKYCIMYNGSEDYHHGEYNDDRENKISYICCERGCSLRELLNNYCKVIKPESKALFEAPPADDERANAIIPERKSDEETKESQEIAIKPKPEVIKRRPSGRNKRKNGNRHTRRITADDSKSKSQSKSSPSKPKNGGGRGGKQRRCRCCKQLRKVPDVERLTQARQRMLLHRLIPE